MPSASIVTMSFIPGRWLRRDTIFDETPDVDHVCGLYMRNAGQQAVCPGT